MAKGHKTGGRVEGTPNKATVEARAAIAQFVDGNAHRLQAWLDEVAQGIKTTVKAKDGSDVEQFVVSPDPVKAFELFQSVIEYHVPKLARTEHTGADGGPIVVTATNVDTKL